MDVISDVFYLGEVQKEVLGWCSREGIPALKKKGLFVYQWSVPGKNKQSGWRWCFCKYSTEVFTEIPLKISVSDFGLIWRPFRKYLQIKKFFQKSGSVTFLPLKSTNVIQKIRKILRAVSEKTALPTNQPINQPTNQPIITNNTNFIGPGWRRSNNKI